MIARLGAALVVTAGLVTLAAARAQFRSGVDVVELNVNVFAGKKPVLDLGPADFEVSDNGVSERVTGVFPDILPIDLTIAVDMSETQGRHLVTPIERAIGRIGGHLKAADRVSVLTFGDRISTLAEAVTPGEASKVKLGTPSGWGTHPALNDALGTVLAAPAVAGRRQLAVVFADSADAGSLLTETDVLDLAGRSRSAVFTLTRVPAGGWGLASFPRAIVEHPDRRPTSFFERLTALTGGRAWTADANAVVHPTPGLLIVRTNATLIDDAFTKAIDEFRSAYVVRYVVGGVPAAGWHDVGVRVRDHRDYVVRTRVGYRID
jgi:hypothetical protein